MPSVFFLKLRASLTLCRASIHGCWLMSSKIRLLFRLRYSGEFRLSARLSTFWLATHISPFSVLQALALNSWKYLRVKYRQSHASSSWQIMFQPSIINHAERLCPRKPRMYGVDEMAGVDIEPIYVHAESAFEAITDYFLPGLENLGIDYGKAAILSPWWLSSSISDVV